MRISHTRPEHAAALEALQRTVFPTLAEAETMTAWHFRRFAEVFPEGQFVALTDDGRVVGSTSTMRCDFDFEHPQHTFLGFTGNLTLSTHRPDGAWLYGLDIMVHPNFRKMGIARMLYRARQAYCRANGLRGQVTTGMLNGYWPRRAEMPPETYFEKLLAGEIADPTVSAQQRIGWEIVGLVPDYLDDPQCGNYGVLLVLPAEKEV